MSDMDLVYKQKEMELMYNKFQQIPFLTQLYKDYEIVPEDDPAAPHVITLLVQLAIQKRINVGAALGILATKLEFSDAAMIIESCVEANIVGYDEKRGELTAVIEPDKDTQKAMSHYMFPPPMLCEPNEVFHNRQSGYLTIDTSVMSRGSYTDDDVCLDVINILNKFRFKLNLDVLQYSSKYKSLSKMKDGETITQYNKRLRQWAAFDETTREIIDKHYTEDDVIRFTHGYESRGRVYCRGYHFNYQGCEWRKALIQFEPEMVEG